MGVFWDVPPDMFVPSVWCPMDYILSWNVRCNTRRGTGRFHETSHRNPSSVHHPASGTLQALYHSCDGLIPRARGVLLQGGGSSSFLVPFCFVSLCVPFTLYFYWGFFSHAVSTLFSDYGTTVYRISHEHLLLPSFFPLSLFVSCVCFVFQSLRISFFFVLVFRRMGKHINLTVNTLTVSTLMSISNGGYILGQSGGQHVSCVTTFFLVAVHNDCRQRCVQAAAFWQIIRSGTHVLRHR